MTDKKKITILSISVLVMVLMNVFTLGMFWWQSGDQQTETRTKKFRFHERRDPLEKHLNFDEEQMLQYEKLKTAHFLETKKYRDQLFETKRKTMDELMTQPFDSLKFQQMLSESMATHANIEKAQARYIRSIVGICDEEQKEQLKKFLPKVLNAMELKAGHPHRMRKHKKRFK